MSGLWVLYTDGACRGKRTGNQAAYGAVLYDENGEEAMTLSDYLGNETPPVAEWYGLLAGLCCAAQAGAKRLIVNMDALTVIDQMTGRCRTRAPHIKPLRERVDALVKQFDEVLWRHVPRSLNGRADALCNETLDRRSNGKHRSR